MTPRRRVAVDAATRADALQRAAQVGAAKAAAELGLKASTIRAWQSRDRDRTRAPLTNTPAHDLQAEHEGAAESFAVIPRAALGVSFAAVAREALGSARKELRDGKPGRAQQAMITAAVAVDKLGVLAAQIAAFDARAARLSEAQQQVLAAVVETYFDAIGLPFGKGSHARSLLASLLRQSGDGAVMSASPELSERARAEIRAVVSRELDAEERSAAHGRPAPVERVPLALPAAGETEVRELERLAGPRRALRVFPDRQDDAIEEVSGEVVDEDPEARRLAMLGVRRVESSELAARRRVSRHRI